MNKMLTVNGIHPDIRGLNILFKLYINICVFINRWKRYRFAFFSLCKIASAIEKYRDCSRDTICTSCSLSSYSCRIEIIDCSIIYNACRFAPTSWSLRNTWIIVTSKVNSLLSRITLCFLRTLSFKIRNLHQSRIDRKLFRLFQFIRFVRIVTIANCCLCTRLTICSKKLDCFRCLV